MIAYLVPTKLEAERYKPQNLARLIIPIEYNNNTYGAVSIISFLKKNREHKILLNGNRLIDLSIIRYASTLGSNVNIVQHGINLYGTNTPTLIAKIIKVLSNFKYILTLINYAVLYLACILKKKKTIKIKIFYFTEPFREFFEKAFVDFKFEITFVKVKRPNVLTWGTTNKIHTVDYYKNFYIDEPLAETLGLGLQADLMEIFKYIDEDDVLHVKLHPRTKIIKYRNIHNIRITDKIPRNVINLFGYKSNLLEYNFRYKNFYQFNSNGKLHVSKLKSSSRAENEDIIIDINRLSYQDLI